MSDAKLLRRGLLDVFRTIPSLARLAVVGLLFATNSAFGQFPTPQLTSLSPPGAKQGGSIDLTVVGADLDDADKLVFSHPGITATAKMGPTSDFQKTPRPVPNSFTVNIAADVPTGIYEARVVGRFGATNPRAFVVSNLDELAEAAGNNAPDKAMELPIGPVVNGRVDANSRDYYKFTLSPNQRVLIECLGQRIDSKIDATLVLYSADGREITRSRDVAFKDPLLDFTSPAGGQFVVAVYDFVYGGGADYFYRLSVHTRPHVDFVFPPSGPAGSNNSYTIYGRNLPGGQPADGVTLDGAKLQKLTVQIPIPADDAARQLAVGSFMLPRSALLDCVDYRLNGGGQATVYVSRGPVIVEQEPNNTPQTAQKVTLPCEFVGQFYPKRDADWIQFDAKKGEAYVIEVLAHRLGLECDPSLIIKKVTKNDKGEEVVSDVAQVDDPGDRNARIGGDFDTSTDDPEYKFTAPDEATYRVFVQDQFGTSRTDPRNVYRLAIRPAEPDFRIVAVAQLPSPQPNQPQVPLGVPVLRRGGTATIDVTVSRRDDFAGEVNLTVEGLPAGVTCRGAILGAAASTTQLVFSATEDAAPWAGPIRIVGKSTVDGKELVRTARAGSVAWGTANRQQSPPFYRVTRDFVLAVTDKDTMPAQVEAGEDKVWETSLGGKIEVPVTLKRRGEYKEAVKLTAVGLPAEIKPNEINLDPNTTAGKLEVAISNQQTKPGVYTFLLRSDTKTKYVRNPDAIKQAEDDQKLVVEIVMQRDAKVKEATTAKDAATKAAQEAAAAAKTADTAKTTAANTAKQTADAAKAAADKATAAKDAAAKDAANQDLAKAAADAQKAADDAAAAAKTAADQAAAADKAATEAAAKAKTAEEARVQSEAALKDAQAKLTEANQKKTEADKRVTDTKQANQPKDVNFPLYSTPIKLRVSASPIKVTPGSAMITGKQGAKIELPVKLERLFGFAEQVELTVEPPKGVAGLTAAKVDAPKDQTDSKLEVALDAKTPAGDHTITIRAKAKFNNVNVESSATVVVKVEPAS